MRLKKNGSQIEIKRDLSRFEDTYYEFQKVAFAGLPVAVASFTPYCVFESQNLILLDIQPQQLLQKTSNKLQYFVVVDTEELKAYECTVESDNAGLKINQIYFFSSEGFLGQSKVSTSINQVCEYGFERLDLNDQGV